MAFGASKNCPTNISQEIVLIQRREGSIEWLSPTGGAYTCQLEASQKASAQQKDTRFQFEGLGVRV